MLNEPECPKCKLTDIIREKQSEYTGGGYADYWEEFFCESCEFEWRSNIRTNYF